MIELGSKAKDVITGFTGIVMARTEYMTGCNQILLVPQKLTKEGKRMEGEWFDEQRIEVMKPGAIRLNNGTTPGCDIPAPKC